MSFRIDLNCDIGESYGRYSLGDDEAILDCVTSVNIACGFHAGDYNVMSRTVQLAKKKGVAVGAHPGFQDLIGFGRRKMEMEPDEVYNLVLYQIGALAAFTKAEGMHLHHVKPHGALYNQAAAHEMTAQAIVDAVFSFDENLILYGLAGSVLVDTARRKGLSVAEEVFADRTYQSDGSLTPRGHVGSVIINKEDAVEQAIRMVKEGVVVATDGTRNPIYADTICIHGDHRDSLSFVQRVSEGLLQQGVTLMRV